LIRGVYWNDAVANSAPAAFAVFRLLDGAGGNLA
jgi:hypothetical protein